MRNKCVNTSIKAVFGALALIMVAQQANAAIALDRTRVIFDGGSKSLSLTISNQNKNLPYLAQAWLENADGQKIENPLSALPPLQRVEPGAKGQVKLQVTGNVAGLPQDRESLYYFNVREIPPKSSKPNSLQLALQTRVKMFYRPTALAIARGDDNKFQKQLTLTRQGNGYQLNNPTPYFMTVSAASATGNGESASGFKPVMVAPKSSIALGSSIAAQGSSPKLTMINDFGGRPQLTFSCSGNSCAVSNIKAG